MSQHRYIRLPDDRVFENGVTESLLTFVEILLRHNLFGLPDNARKSIYIREALKGKSPGDVLCLRVEEWRLLVEAAKRPAFGDPRSPGAFDPDYIRQIIEVGWFDLLLDAAPEAPKNAGE